MRITDSEGTDVLAGSFRGLRLAFWGFVLSWVTLCAGDPQTEGRFTRIDLEQGLSHNFVWTICEDGEGFLWFGTYHGLNRFDGYQFKTFYKDDDDPHTTNLGDDNISDLVLDREGHLWMTTWKGGLYGFDPDKEQFRPYRHRAGDPESLASNHLQSVILAERGALWVGTLDHGINRLDTRTGKVRRYDPGLLPGARIWSMYLEGDEYLWIGTNKGLVRMALATETFEWIGEEGTELDHQREIRSLVADNEGSLWIGTDRNLVVLDLGKGTYAEVPKPRRGPNQPDQFTVTSLYLDRHGRIWAGSKFGGLFCYLAPDLLWRRHQTNPNDPYSISHHDVHDIFEDSSGNLWVATKGGGVNRLNLRPPKFTNLSHAPSDLDSLTFGNVRAIATTRDGLTWVGTYGGGLDRYDPREQSFVHYRSQAEDPTTIGDNYVISILEARDGNLWIGTLNGFNDFDRQTERFVRYRIEEPDPADPTVKKINRIFSLYEDATGRLWLGTGRGVHHWERGTITPFTPDVPAYRNLSAARIHFLWPDREGLLWIGSNKGLARMNQGTGEMTVFGTNNGDQDILPDDAFYHMCDDDETWWLASRSSGLIALSKEDDSVRTFPEGPGIPQGAVNGVLADRRGYVWLSTNRGITRFDPVNGNFRHFDVTDGLRNTQFAKGSAYRSPNGQMFFGGMLGVDSFYPGQISDDGFIAPVVISGFRIMDRDAGIRLYDRSRIELNYRQNFISFEFASLDYTRPALNRYAYYLEGLDPDWNFAGTRRFTTYPNLAPGAYRLHVKATNHDGVWNEDPIVVDIEIKPPFYFTWFAKMSYLAIGFVLVFGFIHRQRERERQRARMELLTEQQKMAIEASRAKSAFLAHMSHELRTPLNAIIGYSELIEEELEEPDDAHPLLLDVGVDVAKIKSAAQYQLSLVNNILDLTKIESGKVDLFVEEFDVATLVGNVLNNIKPMLLKNKNTLKLHYEPGPPGLMITDITKLHGVLLNLLTNANKFTEGGHIHLMIRRLRRQKDHWLEFQVRDTGIGMRPEKMDRLFKEFSQIEDHNKYGGTGLGLFISRYFCRLMGGDIQVASTFGKGSTFTFTLPAIAPTSPTVDEETTTAILAPESLSTHQTADSIS
ncbi:Histidine kinase domain-containing protein [Sulfidibacter corallicola]|uniref:histidine kinase n=1 Tax=Sulfidibacter corallicola TaxID=2818388 RepID=A0A8A4TK49_SULCO|nr:sensor histidine kinase [Sulfidibacter corallicola]QTD49241.1 hypothetical protein J3U87_26955 [Sulfidibacter corallicola]